MKIPKSLEALINDAPIKEYTGIIYTADASPDSLYFVKEGRVYLSKINLDGRKLIFEESTPKHPWFGMDALYAPRRTHQAEAAPQAIMRKIRSSSICSLARSDPEVTGYLVKQEHKRLRILETKLQRLTFEQVHQRLAHQLHDFYIEQGKEKTIRLTHEDLSDFVATYRETVTTILHKFQEDGIVKVRRKEITILDPKRLEDIYS